MMEHDEDKRTRRLLRFAFGLAAIASAGGALAQVTPAEPFGGRPFGADPAAPAPQQRAAQQQQPMVVQPGTAPVLVQPNGTPVVVQPPQQQAIQAPPPPPPPAPVQAQPQQGMAGPSGRPSSSVSPQAGNGTTSAARQERQQDGDIAAPPIVSPPPAPAPAPVTPPFAANRGTAPALGTAGAAAGSPAQQAVRGLPADAPRLVISGSVYSPDAGRRMLIVNGQVFREGADLGSGVVLQEVRPDSAVLGFKGGRYNVYF